MMSVSKKTLIGALALAATAPGVNGAVCCWESCTGCAAEDIKIQAQTEQKDAKADPEENENAERQTEVLNKIAEKLDEIADQQDEIVEELHAEKNATEEEAAIRGARISPVKEIANEAEVNSVEEENAARVQAAWRAHQSRNPRKPAEETHECDAIPAAHVARVQAAWRAHQSRNPRKPAALVVAEDNDDVVVDSAREETGAAAGAEKVVVATGEKQESEAGNDDDSNIRLPAAAQALARNRPEEVKPTKKGAKRASSMRSVTKAWRSLTSLGAGRRSASARRAAAPSTV